jgi:large repetitive protein
MGRVLSYLLSSAEAWKNNRRAPRLLLTGALVIAVFSALSMASPAYADLSASVTLVSGDPTDIYPSETTRLQITLSNSNQIAPITNVAFSNSLPGTWPNGLRISGAYTYTCTDPSGPTTSPGVGTLTADLNTQGLSLSGGNIPARANNTDGTCTIIIPVTAGTSTGSTATYTYQIQNGAVTGDDGSAVANSGTVSQSVNVRALTPPTMSKSFGSSTVYLGGNSTTLTVTLTNTNPVAITNFNITDNFPQLGGSAIIRVAATPGASASCNNGGSAPAFSPSAGDTSVTATGTIPARSGVTNGSCTMTVSIEAAHTNGIYTTGAQTNTINRLTNFSNDIGIVPTANATANVTVVSPLRLTKTFAHAALSSGQSDYLTITLYNDGNTDLTITTFTDDPIDGTAAGNTNPYGLKVIGQSTTCIGGSVAATANNTGVTLTDGTIPHNSSCTVRIDFTGTVTVAGVPISYTNTIPQGAVGTTTAGIVSQSRTASILIADDLRVTKSATPTTAAPGNPVRYTVTAYNYTASAIANLVVTDHLTNGTTFLTGTINGNNYTPTLSGGCSGLSVTGAVGDTIPVFTVATFNARTDINTPSSCSITFYAMTSKTAVNGSSTANTISAGNVCYNAGANCNGTGVSSTGTTVTTTLVSAAKSFAPAGPLAEGSISTMTITLTNQSANPLTTASLSDTLPVATVGGGQMRIATPANAASTCGSPTITAVAGSTSLAMNGGTVPGRASNGTGAAGSCFIRVDVIGPAGTYNNSATVAATETYADGSTHSVGPVSSNTATLVYTSSLSAIKSFNPTGVSSGGRSTVTVRLSNSGAAALTNVGVIDPLPAGMVIAPAPNAYTTCAGTPSITAVAGAGTVTMTGAALAGSGTCDLLFDVVATGGASWVNTIPIGNITADGGVRNQTAVASTLTYNAPTSLTVAKATNPSTLTFPGQVSLFTITITNGTQAVTNLRLTDYFTTNGTSGASANGMVISATPAAGTTCPGGIVTAVAGGTAIGISGVSLGASASCTVNVNVTSTAVGGITNYIPVGAISTDQGLTNSGQATTSLATQSNIGVVKQFTPTVVAPGQRSRLRITFYNPTSLPMANVAVLDTLPAGVTVPSGPNPTSTCAGATVSSPASNQVQVSGGTIAAASGGVAASCYAEIDVTASAQGDYVNTIAAGAVTATSGGVPASNSQPTSDTLRAKSPLVVHKAIGGNTLDAGNPVGFTTGSATRTPGSVAPLVIRIDNPNTVPLTAAAFVDTLPTSLVVATTPNASTTCVGGAIIAPASATSIRLSGATIPASSYCTLTVDVLSNISGSYTNTIAAGSMSTFEGVSNEEPTSAQLIVSNPPTVTKQFSPAVIPTNGTSTLTIFLGNSNASAITLTSAFIDTLPTAPGAIVVAATPSKASTCGGGIAAITAVAGAGSITFASGNTIPVGGCLFSVNVTGATSGVHTNNIPAGALVTNYGTNQQPANSTLTISTMGFIIGRVFRDNNVIPNGTYETGTDTPIAGVSIELHSGANCSGALVSIVGLTNPATTDAVGNYLFSGLPAGIYSVCELVQPSGTVNGITAAGGITSVSGSTGAAGTASNPTSTSSQIVNIVLNGDGTAGAVSGTTGNNFAEVVQSSISGVVFLDQNNNGVQNGADTGIATVAIELLDNFNTVIATTTTDSNGAYSFTNLNPGTYSVREPNQPSNTANGITAAGTVSNGGTAGTVTTPTTTPSVISTIILPPNTATIGNNFAEIPLGRRISGIVFLDYNNDGTFNGSDHGIGSQTLNLTGTDINSNAVNSTVTSNSDGTYDFLNLPEGTYTVNQPNQPAGTTNGTTTAGSTGGTATNPTGTSSRIAAISLVGSNSISANNNFGEQPGAAADLALAKTHSPASLGVLSTTGYFTITPSNVGTIATSGTITLIDPFPAGLTPTAAIGTGWTCGIMGQTVTCTTASIIAAGASGNPIIVHVTVGAGLSGQILINTATISGGGEPVGFDGNNTATDAVAITDSASLQGTVWADANHNRTLDAGEPRLAGWIVELVLNGVTVSSTTSAADGTYSFAGISPSTGYRVRFREPSNSSVFGYPVPNETGAVFANGTVSATNPAGATIVDGTLNNMLLVAGVNYPEQSLPVDPDGVVYDSITRLPVSNATVAIAGPGGFDPAAHLVGGTANATQVTGASGYYQFLLLVGAPQGIYTISVTPPAGYLPGPSTIIPATAGPHAVPAAPGTDAIQTQATAPTGAQPTTYYFTFNMGGASQNVVNNHIPVDPILGGAIAVTKTTPLVNVAKGDLVPYTIEVRNTLAATLSNIDFVDQMPPGFKYRTGSATINGVSATPTASGRTLRWPNLTFTAGEKKTFKILLVVGAGVGEGNYTNQAWALNNIVTTRVSNIGEATVRVVPDPTFDCTDIIGKVFDDKNANGYQDNGEPGLANVRIATVRGLIITTDAEGRFHIACPEVPNADRGSNFILKLDERTLPTGYRVTTENPLVSRMTRGKMIKMNFGASIHRVVRIDVSDEAFEPKSEKLREEWQKKIQALDEQLRERPTVVRIAYRGGTESKSLVNGRIKSLRHLIQSRWKASKNRNPLVFEEEIVETR